MSGYGSPDNADRHGLLSAEDRSVREWERIEAEARLWTLIDMIDALDGFGLDWDARSQSAIRDATEALCKEVDALYHAAGGRTSPDAQGVVDAYARLRELVATAAVEHRERMRAEGWEVDGD